MGTSAGLYGNFLIEEEKKEEFSNLVMQVLYKGGMVQFDSVSCHGTIIYLLHPFKFDEKGWAKGHYNYIDDIAWDTIGYNNKTGRFFTGKIGGNAFYITVVAVYILHEIFCDYSSVTQVNGEIFSGRPYIAWINMVANKAYANNRALDPWSLINLIHNDNPDYLTYISVNDLLSFTNSGQDSDYNQLTAALHVLMGSESFDTFFDKYESKPLQYHLCEKYIYPIKYIGLEALLEMCFLNPKKKIEKIEVEKNESLKNYIIRTIIIHPASIVKSLSEIFHKDFWELWNSYKGRTDIYNAAMQSNQKSIDVINKMHTNEIMRVSDDDLLYYWTPENDDIRLSNKMEQWLIMLKEQIHTIAKNRKSKFTNQEFRLKLTDLLHKCETHYKRIFAFASMYDDFIDHCDDPIYQSALIVFEQIIDENWEAGKEIEKINVQWWDICSHKITCNSGRMNVKRYLAIMANRYLRLTYLGF